MDLQQLEVDLLPLRILLQRILENFLRLRVAAVGEIDLGFGDRIDFVGVDVAQAFAAEIAGQRIVAGIDDAAAGRTEDGVRLDVGARDDAVLEARGLAAAGRDDAGDSRQQHQRTAADRPGRRVAEQVVDERGLGLRRRFLRRRGLRHDRLGLGLGFRRLGLRRRRFRRLRLGAGAAAVGAGSGGDRRRCDAAAGAGVGAVALARRRLRRFRFGASAALPLAASALDCSDDIVWFLSSTARCRSRTVFSSSATRELASLKALSLAARSSASAVPAAAPLPASRETRN